MSARPIPLFVRGAVVVVAALFAAVFAMGGSCGTGEGGCDCIVCTTAIDLEVLDENGDPLTEGWNAEASINGTPVADDTACDPEIRVDNFCTFGFEPGLYTIVVRGNGRRTVETVGRAASRDGAGCCACIEPARVVVQLFPDT